jgi:hypothetical protein
VVYEGAFSPTTAAITLGYPTVAVQSDGTAAIGYSFVGNVTLPTDPTGQSQSAYAGEVRIFVTLWDGFIHSHGIVRIVCGMQVKDRNTRVDGMGV